MVDYSQFIEITCSGPSGMTTAYCSEMQEGRTSSINIKLTKQPIDDVRILFGTSSEYTISNSQYLDGSKYIDFSPIDWSQYKRISIAVKDDIALNDGSKINFSILGINSRDEDFRSEEELFISLIRKNNDVAGIDVSVYNDTSTYSCNNDSIRIVFNTVRINTIEIPITKESATYEGHYPFIQDNYFQQDGDSIKLVFNANEEILNSPIPSYNGTSININKDLISFVRDQGPGYTYESFYTLGTTQSEDENYNNLDLDKRFRLRITRSQSTNLVSCNFYVYN